MMVKHILFILFIGIIICSCAYCDVATHTTLLLYKGTMELDHSYPGCNVYYWQDDTLDLSTWNAELEVPITFNLSFFAKASILDTGEWYFKSESGADFPYDIVKYNNYGYGIKIQF